MVKTLEAHCKKAYPIKRIRNKPIKTSGADKLIEKQNELKKMIDNGDTNKEIELSKIEEHIAEIISKEEQSNANKFKKYCNDFGSVNFNEMWKLKKKIWPSKKECLPCGKKDHLGKIVTESEDLKNLYSKEFKERLRKRPVHPAFEGIQVLKDEIFKLKLKNAKEKKTDDWKIKELEDVLK